VSKTWRQQRARMSRCVASKMYPGPSYCQSPKIPVNTRHEPLRALRISSKGYRSSRHPHCAECRQDSSMISNFSQPGCIYQDERYHHPALRCDLVCCTIPFLSQLFEPFAFITFFGIRFKHATTWGARNEGKLPPALIHHVFRRRIADE
jgi:hypothetical protein